MKKLPLIFLLALTVCLSSCVQFSKSLEAGASPQEGGAVIYGRFALGEKFAGNDVSLRLVEEATGKVRLLRLQQDEPVYAVAVPAGSYRIEGFDGSYVLGQYAGRRKFRDAAWFEVKENVASYVGDFFGHTRMEFLTQEWFVDEAAENYEATTKDFRERYPNLGSLPTVKCQSWATP